MNKSEIKNYLETADNVKEAMEHLAFKLGVSYKRMQSIALDAGFRRRQERSNKGETSCPTDVIDLIAARVRISIKKGAKDAFDINTTIKKEYETLIEEGVNIPVSYERICTLLRNMQLDRKSLTTATPFVRLDSLHVNHVHLFDITNCLQWHLEKGHGMNEEDISKWLYPNKVLEEARKRDMKPKLLRYVMIDHKSRAFYFQYFYTSGERAENGAEFFYNAWADKRPLIEKTLGIADYDGMYQFSGIPKIIYTDGGPIFKDTAIKNLMAALGVEVLIHKTHNPRAKGMVERHMKIIGDNFESNLRRFKIESLDELNAYALDWCIKFNNERVVAKTNKTRSQLWRTIKSDEYTLLPGLDIYNTLIAKEDETRVLNGNCEFTYKGQDYICDNPNFAGQKVIIKIHLSDYPALHLHFNGTVEKAYPFSRDEYGRPQIARTGIIGAKYASHAVTDAEMLKEHIEQVAERVDGVVFTGNNDKRIAKPTLNAAAKPAVKTKKETVAYIVPQGKTVETENPYKPLTNVILSGTSCHSEALAEESKKPILLPISQAIQMLISEYSSITPNMNKNLKRLYPEGVPQTLSATELYNIINKPYVEVDNAGIA